MSWSLGREGSKGTGRKRDRQQGTHTQTPKELQQCGKGWVPWGPRPMEEITHFIRGIAIRQPPRMESGTANLARKVTVCFQMGTESPEAQVSDETRARETMALLCLPGCLISPTCPSPSWVIPPPTQQPANLAPKVSPPLPRLLQMPQRAAAIFSHLGSILWSPHHITPPAFILGYYPRGDVSQRHHSIIGWTRWPGEPRRTPHQMSGQFAAKCGLGAIVEGWGSRTLLTFCSFGVLGKPAPCMC